MAGMLGHIGIGAETTWATAVAATDYLEALSESLATEIARFETRNIVGGIHEADDASGVERHEGDIVLAAHPVNAAYFMKGALGVNTVTSLGNSLFQHEITPATTLIGSLNPLPPYTVEIFRPGGTTVNSSFRYAGVQVNQLQLGVAPNQELRMTAGTIAKSFAYISKTSPTFPTSPVQPFTFDVASISLGGSAITRMEAFNLTYNNNLEGIPTLNNDTEIAKIRRNGPAVTEVSGTIEFETVTDFDSFRNQDEQRLVVSFTRANSFSLIIDIPRTVFTTYPVQIPGRNRLTVDFAMKGRYHSGSGNAVKLTMTTTNTLT